MEENRTFRSTKEVLEEVKGIVCNARNHPSVILYSIFNEEPLQGTERGMRIAARLRNCVRQMDDSRPVLGGFNGGYLEAEGAVNALDVVGINYNPMRYDEFHEKYPKIPLIGSETASAFMVRGEYETIADKNLIGSYDEECAPWGSTHIDAWKWIVNRPYVAGAFVWTGFDYRGEPTPYEWPSIGTFFGVYDACGFSKEACGIYQVMWSEQPAIHIIAPWGHKQKPGEMVKVVVISNCREIQVSINGKVLGFRKNKPFDKHVFEIPFESGVLKAAGLEEGCEVVEKTLESPGEFVALKVDISKEMLYADGMDAVVVNVSAVDAAENLVPDVSDRVHFAVKGGAYIQGVGNGNPNSHEPDKASYRKLFHGRAQAILRNCGKEDVQLEIWMNHIDKITVQIPVKQVNKIPHPETVSDMAIEGWSMYYQLLDEEPDVQNIEINENDRNSFEPIEFHGRPQNVFTGNLKKYGIYYNYFSVSDSKRGKMLYFPDVRGKVQVWMNEKKVFERTESMNGAFMIPLSKEKTGYACIVIIKNEDTEANEAGICAPVMLVDCTE